MKYKNTNHSPNVNNWNTNLHNITILFSVLTILSAAISLLTRITIPAITPLLLGITMFLFAVREYNTFTKYGKEKYHLYFAIIYITIFIFDLIAVASQLHAALM